MVDDAVQLRWLYIWYLTGHASQTVLYPPLDSVVCETEISGLMLHL